jgi:hypothetical protein
MFFVHL